MILTILFQMARIYFNSDHLKHNSALQKSGHRQTREYSHWPHSPVKASSYPCMYLNNNLLKENFDHHLQKSKLLLQQILSYLGVWLNIIDSFLSLDSNLFFSCSSKSGLSQSTTSLPTNQMTPSWRFSPSHPQKSMLLLRLSVSTNPIDPIIHYSHNCHPDYNMYIVHTHTLGLQSLDEENKWHSQIPLKVWNIHRLIQNPMLML